MNLRPALLAALPVLIVATSCGGGSSDAASPTTTRAPATTSTTTTGQATDPADALVARLGTELDDPALAQEVVDGLDPALVTKLDQLAGGDIAGSPKLSYTPTTVPDDEVDTLWVFSYGFRIDPDSPQAAGVGIGETPPPMEELEPGPVNEALAQQAADFHDEHPDVPIIAQWEVAEALQDLGVTGVISVEPDVAADGTVTYLSTDGVVQKGLFLASEQDVQAGHAGVLCFADHANRCLLTAAKNGIEADVPEGVDLPAEYDAESGQTWTRSRETWIPVDLLGRTILG